MSEAAGLYLHVPFCARVCPYCDFAVRTGDAARQRRYVEHLLAEIDLWADWPEPIDTVYFGGGTPSRLDPDDVARIVARARQRLPVIDGARVFLEANPDDVSAATAAGWSTAGVTTLSIGVQTLDPRGLEFLGRQHGSEVARRAVETAHAAGFATVSIDLIYGLPGQTATAWRADMDRALALGPHHVSCYQLTIHQDTRFGLLERRSKLVQLPDDEQAALFRLTHEHMADAGMPGYEVSQFARGPEHHSRHNRKYWNHTPYLGLGPSAHSYRERRRWWNLRRTDPWQERIAAGRRPIEAAETLDLPALLLEALMTGLRTSAGVDLDELRRRWGVDLLEGNGPLLRRLCGDGLARLDGARLALTLDGLALADSVPPLFDVGPGTLQ